MKMDDWDDYCEQEEAREAYAEMQAEHETDIERDERGYDYSWRLKIPESGPSLLKKMGLDQPLTKAKK